MGFIDYFKPVPSISAQKLRDMVRDEDPEGFQLIDVREISEYEYAHIPGAKLVPLSALLTKVNLFDRNKPTVVYCRSGNRSRSAASTLIGEGYTKVFNLTGGIGAWQGFAATGAPEAMMAWFPPDASVQEMVALAWLLEEGSRKFYQSLAEKCPNPSASEVFSVLVKAEEKHKESLMKLFEKLTGNEPCSDFPACALSKGMPSEDIMEGGLSVKQALKWCERREPQEIFELSMALETNALDLYLKMARSTKDEGTKAVFKTLSEEEHRHLEKLSEAFLVTLGK